MKLELPPGVDRKKITKLIREARRVLCADRPLDAAHPGVETSEGELIRPPRTWNWDPLGKGQVIRPRRDRHLPFGLAVSTVPVERVRIELALSASEAAAIRATQHNTQERAAAELGVTVRQLRSRIENANRKLLEGALRVVLDGKDGRE